MAYTHDRYEVILHTTGLRSYTLSATGTTQWAQWGPASHPHIVRSVSVQPLTATFVNAPGVISFRDVSRFGASGTTGNQFTTITLATDVKGTGVFYKDGLNQEISVGDGLVAVPTTTPSDAMIIRAMVEPRWENPANDTTFVTG